MTIAIITDQHLDGRKNSKVFWDYFLKFYDDIFFPALDKYKIKTVLDLGDTFDNRKNIDLAAWYRIKKHYFQRLYYFIVSKKQEFKTAQGQRPTG